MYKNPMEVCSVICSDHNSDVFSKEQMQIWPYCEYHGSSTKKNQEQEHTHAAKNATNTNKRLEKIPFQHKSFSHIQSPWAFLPDQKLLPKLVWFIPTRNSTKDHKHQTRNIPKTPWNRTKPPNDPKRLSISRRSSWHCRESFWASSRLRCLEA